ncbi:GIY-YIG nuclease family protein [Flavobacterium sp.]|uniref:GIY-YIG nuclease family protein n=1 Tax=Flavobacterium sp. TaxID=239 RepID=UPI003751C6D5
MKSYFVYIIKCSDNSYYTGFTNDIERRFNEHVSGRNKSCYTFNKHPLELMWFETFNDVLDAIATEKKIKGWSRIKKEALIENNWDKIELYSKNYSQFGKPNIDESSTSSDRQ